MRKIAVIPGIVLALAALVISAGPGAWCPGQ
jgi:hypothetical protein